MDAVEQIDRMGDATVADWAATVRQCWVRACEADGIDPAAAAVVFSADNPVVLYLNRAIQSYQEALANRTAFGYTGLVITGGKAKIPPPVKGTRRGKKPV